MHAWRVTLDFFSYYCVLQLGEKAEELASNVQETFSNVQEKVVNGGHITRTVAQVSAEKAAAAAEENRKK